MIIYTIKTSRGGRPKTFHVLEALIEAIRQDLIDKRDGMGKGKIIIEIEKKGS